jgi:hypothetical protein
MLKRVYWLQLIFITSSMAAVETTSKGVLAACTFSFVAGAMLDLTARGYVAGTACFGCLCLVFLAATAYFTWQVEDMERIAAKYRAADEGLQLQELGEQELGEQELESGGLIVPPLGPIATTVDSLRQGNSDASSLVWLMATAKRLSDPFEVTVLYVLYEVLLEGGETSSFPAPSSNLKSYERAYEKSLLDYGKNCQLLKDMLRGSIICKTMRQLRKVWQRLQRLQAEGVLKILQVKNRFRGKPFSTGYRGVNCNVEFEGFICEIQLHCEGHYALKDEQHHVYSLCRSFGLMGDIADTEKNEEATATATGDMAVPPSLKMRVAVLFLRSVSCVLAFIWGMDYFTLGIDQDVVGVYDELGFDGVLLICKVLSLCFPFWIVGGMLLMDLWKDGKVGFFVSLAFTFFVGSPILGYFRLQYRFIAVFSWALPLLYFIATRLLWLRARDTANATARTPRVALLYRQYFGIDGEYFAWKNAAMQSLSVLLQARAKLLPIGFVVADGITEGWYWAFFGVLLLNCVAPPLLLSSEQPWRRQQGAMLFDGACDLFYVEGFALFMYCHQGNLKAMLPTDVGSFFSNLFPLLRILSIGRILLTPRRRGVHRQKNAQATGVDNGQAGLPLPSRLTPKMASFFATLSLLMLATVVGWERDVYPWDTNPCRPCECSSGRILERCEHGGTQLFLAARGITRVLPGAFVEKELPHLREINLGRNAIIVLESGTFVHLPALKGLSLGSNRVNTTSWFLETFLNTLRVYVPTESGLASIERNAFANNSQLEFLGLKFNSLGSIDSLGGIFSDAPGLEMLWLDGGNALTCDGVVPYFDGTCIWSFSKSFATQ